MFTTYGLDLAILFLCYKEQIPPKVLFMIVMVVSFVFLLYQLHPEHPARLKAEEKKLKKKRLELEIAIMREKHPKMTESK